MINLETVTFDEFVKYSIQFKNELEKLFLNHIRGQVNDVLKNNPTITDFTIVTNQKEVRDLMNRYGIPKTIHIAVHCHTYKNSINYKFKYRYGKFIDIDPIKNEEIKGYREVSLLQVLFEADRQMTDEPNIKHLQTLIEEETILAKKTN